MFSRDFLEIVNISRDFSRRVPVSGTSNVYSVCVRGKITMKMFSLWNSYFTTSNINLFLSNEFEPNCLGVVIDEDLSKESLSNWSSICFFPKTILFIKKDWIVDIMKTRVIQPIGSYVINFFKMEDIAKWISPMAKDLVADSSSVKQALNQPYKKKYRFACELSGTDDAVHRSVSNKRIVEIIDELQEVYELLGDEWRSNSYKRCSGILMSRKEINIANVKELDNVKGIGKSIREKIEEILCTGTLQKLENFRKDPKVQSIMALSKIWGVGVTTANRLYAKGIHSIQALRSRGLHLLNQQQLIGLSRYEDLLQRIPRDEVTQIGEIVVDKARS